MSNNEIENITRDIILEQTKIANKKNALEEIFRKEGIDKI